jgi:hypothetical protein
VPSGACMCDAPRRVDPLEPGAGNSRVHSQAKPVWGMPDPTASGHAKLATQLIRHANSRLGHRRGRLLLPAEPDIL